MWLPRLGVCTVGYKECTVNCRVSLHQNNEDTCFIVLNKKEGSGLGFSVVGGADVEPKSVMVSSHVTRLLEYSSVSSRI